MNKNPNLRKIKDLKIKFANLELEIRSLLDAGKSEPGIIDAVASDISDFTDEIMKVKKELKGLGVKVDETKLTELYQEVKESKLKEIDDDNMEGINPGEIGPEIDRFISSTENILAELISGPGGGKYTEEEIKKFLVDIVNNASVPGRRSGKKLGI
jgi:hypothetical protein